MPQELLSAQCYFEAGEDELRANLDQACRRTNARLCVKLILTLVFWGAILGGGGFMACRALRATQQPKSDAGHGAGPALSILTFFANLVDFNWDSQVEDRIQSNQRGSDQRYPYEVDEIPEITVDDPDIRLD